MNKRLVITQTLPEISLDGFGAKGAAHSVPQVV